MGLLGFLFSIARFRTRLRYGLLATTCIVFFTGILALALAIGGWAFSIDWNVSVPSALSLLTAFAPSALIAILILSFLLFIYNALISRD